MRFHESIEDYPHNHGEWDDHSLYTTDNFERMKPHMAKSEDVVGTTPVVPIDDNDFNLKFYDIQGESLYTNPPDPNLITMDHGLDEDHIWSFRMTLYNQSGIFNNYTKNIFSASRANHVPFWGLKLSTPAFYKDHKLQRYFKQWSLRLGLEQIKLRHAKIMRPNDPAQQRQFKQEVMSYIAHAYEQDQGAAMENVFVTDHKLVPKKYSTLSEEEDAHFYRIEQDLAAHEERVGKINLTRESRGRYERGSLAQVVFEPLAGATKDENGTTVYRMTEREVNFGLTEEGMRKEFDLRNNLESMDFGEAEGNDLRVMFFDQMEQDSPFNENDWSAVISKEFNVFQEGEKYDYVKDMRHAYSEGLSKSLSDKIFETIPDYVFWDIKKPINMETNHHIHRYNPARPLTETSFF